MGLDPKVWWYVTRASGFVSWALLAIAVLWGLFVTNKTLTRSTAPAWVLDLHRHLGGLSVVFVAVHVGVLPLDTFTDWGWRDLLIPMASQWHPGATAWGIVAMYLLIAIEVTSLLGRRYPKKWWRRVHMLSFPLYILASIHLFAAGTDSGNTVGQWLVVIVSTLIMFLTVVRVLAATKPRETRPNPRIAAARAQAAAIPSPASPPALVGACASSTQKSTSARQSGASFGAEITGDLLPAIDRETPAPPTRTPSPPIADEPANQPAMTPMSLDERAAHIRERSAAAANHARSRARAGATSGGAR